MISQIFPSLAAFNAASSNLGLGTYLIQNTNYNLSATISAAGIFTEGTYYGNNALTNLQTDAANSYLSVGTYVVGSQNWAYNGNTLVLFSNDTISLTSCTNDTTALTTASNNVSNLQNLINSLTSGGKISINTPGIYAFNLPIALIDNITVELGENVIFVTVGTNYDGRMFYNANPTTGNKNIKIVGKGIIFSNGWSWSSLYTANSNFFPSIPNLLAANLSKATPHTTYVYSNTLHFENVNGFEIGGGLTIIGTIKYSIFAAMCSNFWIHNIAIYGDDPTYNIEGIGPIMIDGNCDNGVIEKITGVNNDDFVCINTADFQPWINSRCIGGVRNILIKDISVNVRKKAGCPINIYANSDAVANTLDTINAATTISVGINPIVTYNSHGLTVGTYVWFQQLVAGTSGVLPTGLLPSVCYLISAVTTNTFSLTNVDGSSLTTSVIGSGTVKVFYGTSACNGYNIAPQILSLSIQNGTPVVTAITDAPHKMEPGDAFYLSGATSANYNTGSWLHTSTIPVGRVIDTPTPTTFTYICSNYGGLPGAPTVLPVLIRYYAVSNITIDNVVSSGLFGPMVNVGAADLSFGAVVDNFSVSNIKSSNSTKNIICNYSVNNSGVCTVTLPWNYLFLGRVSSELWMEVFSGGLSGGFYTITAITTQSGTLSSPTFATVTFSTSQSSVSGTLGINTGASCVSIGNIRVVNSLFKNLITNECCNSQAFSNNGYLAGNTIIENPSALQPFCNTGPAKAGFINLGYRDNVTILGLNCPIFDDNQAVLAMVNPGLPAAGTSGSTVTIDNPSIKTTENGSGGSLLSMGNTVGNFGTIVIRSPNLDGNGYIGNVGANVTGGRIIVENFQQTIYNNFSLIGLYGKNIDVIFKSCSSSFNLNIYNVNSGNTLRSEGGNNFTGSLINSASTNAMSVYGFDLPVDVAGGKISRVNGLFCFNSNDTSSTLGAAGLVVCQGTVAGSWHLLSNPSTTY